MSEFRQMTKEEIEQYQRELFNQQRQMSEEEQLEYLKKLHMENN